jgi:hypothetical protein
MTVLAEAAAPAVQLSAQDEAGRFLLSVLVKRTYTLTPDGRCLPRDEQLPLVGEPEADPDCPELLGRDTDLYPLKPATDVVVKGHAYGQGRRQFEAAVAVNGRGKRILVLGDRRCDMTGGQVRFSQPGPVERVPLRYTHAYGGRDAAAEAKHGNPLAEMLARTVNPKECDLSQASPFLYPRNPCGKGYLVEATPAADGLELPNLEDPRDRLTPERLAAGDPLDWPRMPLPQATDWVGYEWFPRIAYLRLAPPYRLADGPPAEVARGHCPADLLDDRLMTAADAFRLTCGASLGLQLPHLRGGETVVLENMHPTQPRLAARLPAERPRIWTDGRKGKLNETQPVIHTLVIEPDEGRLSVVWRGAAPALRPYLPQELEKMPFRVAW